MVPYYAFTLFKFPILKMQIPKSYHAFPYTVRIGLLEYVQVELKAETFTTHSFCQSINVEMACKATVI